MSLPAEPDGARTATLDGDDRALLRAFGSQVRRSGCLSLSGNGSRWATWR